MNLKKGDEEIDSVCEKIYNELCRMGLEIIYDDREERAGAKFAAMDLIGIPMRVTVGPRGIQDRIVEVRFRSTGKTVEMSVESVVSYCFDEFKEFLEETS